MGRAIGNRMSTTDADAAQLPGDLDMTMEQIRDITVPLTKALEYVSKRAQAAGVSASELQAWRTTRNLLAAAAERYDGATAILQGGAPPDAHVDERVDAQALSHNLRALEQVVAGWKMLTTGKWNATNETATIWKGVLARGERLSPQNQEMIAHFEADRRDLETTGTRLRLALEYLWRNGRPRPTDEN
jgi:hypothetical protein